MKLKKITWIVCLCIGVIFGVAFADDEGRA